MVMDTAVLPRFQAVAVHVSSIDVPVYAQYNNWTLNLEVLERLEAPYLRFDGWALVPVGFFREGRIRAEYAIAAGHEIRVLFEQTSSVLVLDDGQVVGLCRKKLGKKFPTYDFFERCELLELFNGQALVADQTGTD